jgi:peptidyl-prolyl cis-trans isomerase C
MTLFRSLAFAAALAFSTNLATVGAGAEDRVVAKVNGHEITAKEVELAADDILPQLGDVPPKLRFPFVVEYLVERHLLAQAAVKEGMADSEEYKRRLAFYQAKALRDAYFSEKLKPGVTEDAVRKAYDEQAAKIAPEERVRARHILVASEAEAKDVIDRLTKGEKFEELARQVSLDGSKDFGGDLGYFTAVEMVPEFSQATFALKVGEVSAPVKTEYGWHVIRLEDRKSGGPQPYEQVKNAIKLVLLREAVQNKLVELRQTATIEVLDSDLKQMQEENEKRLKELQAQKKLDGTPQTATGGKSDLAQ